jgi:hypothetical protein
MHQTLLRKIKSHRPEVIRLIDSYNRLVDRLTTLNKPTYNIPIPPKLHYDLRQMRLDGLLMEDVWIEPCTSQPPRWFSDESVRKAIRGVQKLDQCREERARVSEEAVNMLNWFQREVTVVEIALKNPGSEKVFQMLLMTSFLPQIQIYSIRCNWSGIDFGPSSTVGHGLSSPHLSTI